MNNDEKENLIAEYGVVQGGINASSQVITQIFGFSVAAIVALIATTIQTKNILLPSWCIFAIVFLSASQISVETKKIVGAETYIVVFIESRLQGLRWKQRLFEKYRDHKNGSSNAIFARFSIFSDFAGLVYTVILISIGLSSAYNLVNLVDNWKNSYPLKPFPPDLLFLGSLSFFSLFFAFVLSKELIKYVKGDYYDKLKEYWENQKKKEQLGKLDHFFSLEPSYAKLVESSGEEVPIPKSAYEVLRQVIHLTATGQTVSVVPQEPEVTIQEAADLLNVSRSFLTKLLEEGKIPCITIGAHRRIRLQDLMAYKKQRDTKRSKSLDQLSQMSQDEGFYEDEVIKE